MQDNADNYSFLGFFRWIFGGCAAAGFALFLLLVGNSGMLQQKKLDSIIIFATHMAFISSVILLSAVAIGEYNKKTCKVAAEKGTTLQMITGFTGLLIFLSSTSTLLYFIAEKYKPATLSSYWIIPLLLMIYFTPIALFATNAALLDTNKKRIYKQVRNEEVYSKKEDIK
ncbi:MAG: hypothetical protein IBX50_19130 [Marinospirillum sp.]|uniref:hypothetical protein n=1 Tax=Marinospirillum sp. TaxID=2183934 RepID=UPI0019F8C31E|nr:hypothetical protein [Marinospirillum sp.]MBE0508804.1 hypothetical protein [Marinospirillum sp.]